MTDIVKKLSEDHWWLSVSGDEAAEEIKLLRDEIEQWKGRYEGMLAVAKTADAENKQIRANITITDDVIARWAKDEGIERDAIERLWRALAGTRRENV